MVIDNLQILNQNDKNMKELLPVQPIKQNSITIEDEYKHNIDSPSHENTMKILVKENDEN